MRALSVLGVVLLALVLLARLRIGVQGEYGAAGAVLRLRVGPLRLQVLPWPFPGRSGKKSAKKKPAPPAGSAAQEEKKPAPPPLPQRMKSGWETLQAVLPPVLEAASSFRKKLCVDELELQLTVGGDDPAEAALNYGRANAALGALWYPMTECLNVKDGHAGVIWQQDSSTPIQLAGRVSLSLRLGQLLCLAARSGIQLFRIYRTVRSK